MQSSASRAFAAENYLRCCPDVSPAASGGASGNPVVFSIDGSSGAGVCSISSGTVSFTGVGTCVIDAEQAATPTSTWHRKSSSPSRWPRARTHSRCSRAAPVR